MMHLATLISDVEMAIPAVWAWLSACEPAATTLVTSIWQGVVIVCGLEIALRLMPRISAAHRFAMWAGGFAIAVGLPWVPLLHFGAGGAAGSIGAGPSAGAAAPLLRADARWVVVIAVVWAAASAARALGLLAHSVRLRRLWKTAQPIETNVALMTALKDVRGGGVAICTTGALDRPSVIGFFAPRILIPEWLLTRLTPGELEQIVLHEAEHLRRRDDWTNLIQKLLLVAFPLNPALAWIEHRLCREREMACDEGVVRTTNAPRAYAACLASLAERGLERRSEALSLGAWQRRSELVHRVHGILRRKRGLSKAAASALMGTVGCGLIAGSVEMARCPQVVAFVPEQRSLTMTPERQRAMTAMLAQENAEARMTLPRGFRAVPAKEIMPEKTRLGKRRPLTGGAIEKARDGSVQQMAKADEAGDRVNRTPEQPRAQEQQWVVLAAWEEVQTIRHTSVGATRDYESNTPAEVGVAQQGQKEGITAGHTADKTPQQNQTASQYTVTRLILRVVPANPNSTQSAAGMARGGWFVIQL